MCFYSQILKSLKWKIEKWRCQTDPEFLMLSVFSLVQSYFPCWNCNCLISKLVLKQPLNNVYMDLSLLAFWEMFIWIFSTYEFLQRSLSPCILENVPHISIDPGACCSHPSRSCLAINGSDQLDNQRCGSVWV